MGRHISIVTPHWRFTNPFIAECYESLRRQTLSDWEWVIIVNNGGDVPESIVADDRVKVIYNFQDPGIGELKKQGFEKASSDFIVELDADDLLMETALQDIYDAFQSDARVHFVYSNSAQFDDKTWKSDGYSSYYGWRSRPFKYQEHDLVEMIAFPPTVHALRAIYWCPNHVRAWRKEVYHLIGGHNENYDVIDDYELLCRTYLWDGIMKHIDKCLYLYRRYPEQTTRVRNGEIQQTMWKVYTKYIIPMVEKWADREGMPRIDLGCGKNKAAGYIGYDMREGTCDVVCNLEEGIPADESSVGVVRAYDFLEHVDPVKMMNEIYRILVPGGWLLASIPSTDGRGAFQDPGHKSFWNMNSFWYYTDPQVQQYVPGLDCKFQVGRVIEWYPSEWHKSNKILYLDVQLIAIKEGYHQCGECPGENKWRR